MISHKRKCVFIHIPKCAGQSIETVFVIDSGLTWSNRAPLLLRPNPDRDIGPPFLAHLTYREYLRYSYISQELMDDYYKFTVVRNPYSRLESIYKYKGYSSAISFEDFVMKVVPGELKADSPLNYFFKPQVEFIKDSNGSIKVDDIFRLEEIGKVVSAITRLGVCIEDLPHINKAPDRGFLRALKRRLDIMRQGYYDISIFPDSKVCWNKDMVSLVNRLYGDDFNQLKYDMR